MAKYEGMLNLKLIRTKRKMTQQELGNLVGVNRKAICCYEAAPEVVQYAEGLKARYEAMQAALVKSWGERDKSAVWRQLKRNGCGACKNCESYGEDSFWCSACGEELRTENRPTPYAEMYHLYNWVPFPSENCPKKYPAAAGK